ncbi:MAG TPA: hypothetical protein VFQ61_31200 [Polyangiaceae bacterium]|nr:hypothetical protein [Polyangiaceae bacterium]
MKQRRVEGFVQKLGNFRASVLLFGFSAACSSGAPDLVTRNDGPAPLEVCVNGGELISIGADKDESGTLEDSEVTSHFTVCNGSQGNSPLFGTVDEPAGEHCAGGGKRIVIGFDNGAGGGLAANGTLEDGEITRSDYVCNGDAGAAGPAGADGTNGQDGVDGRDGIDGQNGTDGTDSLPTLVRVVSEPASAEHCPTGGQRIEIGLDSDASGSLSDEEVQSTEFACNGLDGENGAAGEGQLLRTTRIPAGDQCPAGGELLEFGLDNGQFGSTARDEILQDEEVRSAIPVCDGVSGSRSLVAWLAEPAGERCPGGGRMVLSGQDDGLGGGTAGDGVLQTGEVRAANTVCNGINGKDAITSLVNVTPEPAGANCSGGGQRITSGLDNGAGGSAVAGNGVLETGEVLSTSFVCHGVNGTNGTNGTNGATSLVSVTAQAAGPNCANGGYRVSTGLDDGAGGGKANDGTLQAGEIDSISYVCNGTNGTNGTNGVNGANSLVRVSVETAGVNCTNGGRKIEAGLDDGTPSGTARDGQLQAGEIDTTSYVCNGTNGINGTNGTNGTNGSSSLVKVSTESAGPNCTAGGRKVESGLDDGSPTGTARDGILQAGEVESTSYICNGANGTNGTSGTNGYNSLVSLTPVAAGAACTNGGTRVNSGLDNGAGGGTARNGVLEPGEVTSVEYVCDGGGPLNSGILTDANGAALGRVVSATNRSLSIVTSKGYLTTLSWAGVFPAAQIYYTSYAAGVCGGSAYLNAASSSSIQYMYGKNLVWSAAFSSFMTVPASHLMQDGTAISVQPASSGFTIQGWENPTCAAQTSNNYMWPLVTISRSAVGLPASIAPPLTIN